MKLYIASGDGLPIYRQIVRQVIDAIAAGRLGPGERLHSQRELAQALVISPLTVKKAYDELRGMGYIDTLQGRGTFVSRRLPRLSEEDERERLRGAARRLMSEAELVGISFARLVTLLRAERTRLREGVRRRVRR